MNLELPVRVLLADDHPLVLDGLRLRVEADRRFQVVGQLTNGLEVVPAVQRLRPELLLLDLTMPGLTGGEILRQLNRRFPRTRVIVVSMWADPVTVAEALRNGAWGYVVKEAGAEAVSQALAAVLRDEQYLSAPLDEHEVRCQLARLRAQVPRAETLTPREREVLKLSAEGLSNPRIAERLFLSVRTVESHRARVLRKLELTDQTDLVKYAIRSGLIPPPQE
ncbi:MAG: response regulator [Armatimonadota bacterium]